MSDSLTSVSSYDPSWVCDKIKKEIRKKSEESLIVNIIWIIWKRIRNGMTVIRNGMTVITASISRDPSRSRDNMIHLVFLLKEILFIFHFVNSCLWNPSRKLADKGEKDYEFL